MSIRPRLTDVVMRAGDPGAEQRFWSAGLGLSRVFPAQGRPLDFTMMLDAGGHLLEFHLERLVRPVPASRADAPVTLSLWVRSAPEAMERALRFGGTAVEPVRTFPGSDATYGVLASPSGQAVLLLQGDVTAYRASKGLPPLAAHPDQGPVLNEIVLRVPDLDRESAFLEAIGLRRLPAGSASHIRQFALQGPILEVIGNAPPVDPVPSSRHDTPVALNLLVPDLEDALARAVHADGTALMPPQEEGEGASFVYVRTPSGHVVTFVTGDVDAYRQRLEAPPLPRYPEAGGAG